MKKIILMTILLGVNLPAFAESTTAIGFAQQAGVIAGTAQGCGIDTSLFASRVSEALARMAQSAPDRAYAVSAYQSSMQQAKNTQATRHAIDCTQAAQDFKNLPLMRDDYQETVLSKIAPPQQSSVLPGANPVQMTPAPLPGAPQLGPPTLPSPQAAPVPAAPPPQSMAEQPSAMPNVAVTK